MGPLFFSVVTGSFLLMWPVKPLTAFSTHKEYLQLEVMPFGLCNAPLSFARLMDQVLRNLPNVYCYLDDITVLRIQWFCYKDSPYQK